MIDIKNVSSVYSGKNGRCCCGCSGTHYYASSHREWSSKNRGYIVTDEDVNDNMVKRVVNIINSNPASFIDKEYVSVILGNRLYTAYFVA